MKWSFPCCLQPGGKRPHDTLMGMAAQQDENGTLLWPAAQWPGQKTGDLGGAIEIAVQHGQKEESLLLLTCGLRGCDKKAHKILMEKTCRRAFLRAILTRRRVFARAFTRP